MQPEVAIWRCSRIGVRQTTPPSTIVPVLRERHQGWQVADDEHDHDALVNLIACLEPCLVASPVRDAFQHAGTANLQPGTVARFPQVCTVATRPATRSEAPNEPMLRHGTPARESASMCPKELVWMSCEP
jgi:hypothetical protein